MGIIRLFCILVALSGCQFFFGESSHRENSASLSQEYALARSRRISNVEYDLFVNLTRAEYFSGKTKIQFQLKSAFPLSLDFSGGEVLSLVVNQNVVSEPRYNGHFIEIPEELQRVGANIVEVQYRHPYSNNGTGLYRFVDPEDQSVYIYSQFEAYYANHMFPCFDQPDLKARYATEVLAPKDWQVISATRETQIQPEGENTRWMFPSTERFSTYGFSLHAGNYSVWESQAKTDNHEVPLRLFARKSMAKYVDTEEWFGLTQSGFVFFEDYFKYAYPFHKYDQVIVPDFNHGGMENIGAVIYSEDRFVSRGEKSRDQKRKLALVLYHELAHMWFGNLVTMKWWNDLWLNESFATYISYVGLDASTDFNEVWQHFNTRSKQRAYRLDQSTVTHAVATPVDDTRVAFSNFDAITYGKGASALKQLSYAIGPKNFRNGLRAYFKEFEFKNTELKDFVGAMEKASDRDLATWQLRWLETPMHNNLETHVVCRKGRIESFELYQTGSREFPTLRNHKTRIGLFRNGSNGFSKMGEYSVRYQGETTQVNKLKGKLCPDLVYPNMGDHDFVRIQFDKRSLKNISENLVSLKSPLLRNQIWSDLWQMVLNQDLNMERYLEIVEFNGLVETDPTILSGVHERVRILLKEYYPVRQERWRKKQDVWVKFFEQAYWNRIKASAEDPKLQRLWFDTFVGISESDEVRTALIKLLKRGTTAELPLKFVMDQEQRWQILAVLAKQGDERLAKLLEVERKRDISARGQRQALLLKVLGPDESIKDKLFQDLLGQRSKRSYADSRVIMENLFTEGQRTLYRSFQDRFYKSLQTLNQGGEVFFASQLAKRMPPQLCDKESSQRLSHSIQANKTLAFPIVKSLKAALYENERCRQMRHQLLKENRARGVEPS